MTKRNFNLNRRELPDIIINYTRKQNLKCEIVISSVGIKRQERYNT